MVSNRCSDAALGVLGGSHTRLVNAWIEEVLLGVEGSDVSREMLEGCCQWNADSVRRTVNRGIQAGVQRDWRSDVNCTAVGIADSGGLLPVWNIVQGGFFSSVRRLKLEDGGGGGRLLLVVERRRGNFRTIVAEGVYGARGPARSPFAMPVAML